MGVAARVGAAGGPPGGAQSRGPNKGTHPNPKGPRRGGGYFLPLGARAPRAAPSSRGETPPFSLSRGGRGGAGFISLALGRGAPGARHFEQVIHALLLSSLGSREGTGTAEPQPEWVEAMERMSAASQEKYEALVKRDPALLDFFRTATPFPELGTLNLASRPVSRAGEKAQLTLEDLRAIPWVFSWTQTRINLPGWYGLGTALSS